MEWMLNNLFDIEITDGTMVTLDVSNDVELSIKESDTPYSVYKIYPLKDLKFALASEFSLSDVVKVKDLMSKDVTTRFLSFCRGDLVA